MRTGAILFAALVLTVPFLAGCPSCDPNRSVPIRINAEAGLNPYDGGPHKTDLYFFYLSVPGQFEGASVDQLAGASPSVPAGTFAGRKNVGPGEQLVHRLGPRALESYRYVGVLARFYQNPQKAVTEIPPDCTIELWLGPRSIEKFKAD